MCGMSTTSPSPRPLTRKGQETRQRIVDAAAGLIFRQGVAHTTIEDVRAAADVSSSQLYHYFEDKTALVRAVVDHQADTMVGGQENFDFSTLDGLRAWRDFVIAAQREQALHRRLPNRLSRRSAMPRPIPTQEPTSPRASNDGKPTIQSGLREMHARGELPPDTDPDTLALALLAALQGGLLLTQVKRDTKPLEAALDAMLELVARLSGGS